MSDMETAKRLRLLSPKVGEGLSAEPIMLYDGDGEPFDKFEVDPWTIFNGEPTPEGLSLITDTFLVGANGPGNSPSSFSIRYRREGKDLLRVEGQAVWDSIPEIPAVHQQSLWFLRFAKPLIPKGAFKVVSCVSTVVPSGSPPGTLSNQNFANVTVVNEINSALYDGILGFGKFPVLATGDKVTFFLDFVMAVSPRA